MAKLTTLKPRLNALPSRIAVSAYVEPAQRLRQRDASQAYRKWYKTSRWQKLRMQVLIRDLFQCQMCSAIVADTSLLVCDHIEPHRGDEEKFWNGPFQALCKTCHDGLKQSIDWHGKQAAFRPKWLKPSIIPLTIVCGAPASGKSTYVKHHANSDDLIIDLDEIVSALSNGPLHGWERDRWLHPALFKRNDMLGTLSRPCRYKAAWLIVSEPKAFNRAWWVETMKPQSLIVLETPEAQCISNARNDADRNLRITETAIVKWWFEYTRRNGDVIV